MIRSLFTRERRKIFCDTVNILPCISRIPPSLAVTGWMSWPLDLVWDFGQTSHFSEALVVPRRNECDVRTNNYKIGTGSAAS